MKRNNRLPYICLLLATVSILLSCKKFEPEVVPMTPINVNNTDSYSSLEENTLLSIPIKFTTENGSDIQSASYIIVNNRPSEIAPVKGPAIPIPFNGKSVETTIKVPVRTGLIGVVIVIYDKTGKMSSKSINVQSVTPSNTGLKQLSDVVMSTDPADNQNFFSFYEPTPVFGHNEALTKQARIDIVAVNMGGAKLISPNAYGASSSYYNASKDALAGFTELSYSFLTSSRTYINRTNFNSLTTDAQLTKFLNDTIMAIPANGGANYNIVGSDRRVSDTYGISNVEKGFVLGWGYRSHPTSTTEVLNESFAIILVKSVTKKTNGHYVITFDIKGPSVDQRALFSATTIAPYDPYPL
jgi:hypothetical protein